MELNDDILSIIIDKLDYTSAISLSKVNKQFRNMINNKIIVKNDGNRTFYIYGSNVVIVGDKYKISTRNKQFHGISYIDLNDGNNVITMAYAIYLYDSSIEKRIISTCTISNRLYIDVLEGFLIYSFSYSHFDIKGMINCNTILDYITLNNIAYDCIENLLHWSIEPLPDCYLRYLEIL